MAESKQESIKRRTLELYDSLPQDRAARMARTDIRDQIIDLNYTFFGYVASHTYINNTSITYDDKVQSAFAAFLKCWFWFKWEGGSWIEEKVDENGNTVYIEKTHKGYRTDLSFTVFFKPRIGEEIERELNEVKYSLRRTLCMEVGAQIGKSWGQVKYDDLSDPRVKISSDKMSSLKAMFGAVYWADLSEHETFIASEEYIEDSTELVAQNYDSLEDILIQEMICQESAITDLQLHTLAETYQIEYTLLKLALPRALELLHTRLLNNEI